MPRVNQSPPGVVPHGIRFSFLMKTSPPIPDRLKAASPGVGQPSETEIEQRARELALIDGRNTFTDADLARAAQELGGGVEAPAAPEVEAEVEQLEEWDSPVEQDGHEVAALPPEDEANVAEQLIEEGLSEADHDRRVAAAEDSEKA